MTKDAPLAYGTVSQCVAMGKLIEEDYAARLAVVRSRMNSLVSRIHQMKVRNAPPEVIAELEQELREAKPGRLRDAIESQLGFNWTAYERARVLMRAAEREPERFGDLVAKMDKDGRVAAAFGEYERRMGKEKRKQPSRALHSNPTLSRTPSAQDSEMMDRTVRTLDGVGMALDLVDVAKLDPKRVGMWMAVLLETSIRLRKFHNALMERLNEGLK